MWSAIFLTFRHSYVTKPGESRILENPGKWDLGSSDDFLRKYEDLFNHSGKV